MFGRLPFEGKNLSPVSKMGVVYGQKGNAPITWKSAPFLPKNPFVSPLEIYNTLVHSANSKYMPKSGGIYHQPIIYPIHGIPKLPPWKTPKVTLPPKLINPFRIEPLPSPEPIRIYPTPGPEPIRTYPTPGPEPIRIYPTPGPEPIRTYPTPINCSTLKTCPNGERVSICSPCPTKQKTIVKSPEQEQGSNALGGFISSALMFLPFL